VDLRSWNQGYFVQDDWKISSRLTLNLGARYELVLPFLDRYDRMGIFDTWTNPASPRLIYAGTEGKDRYNRAMYATDTNNIMPRVGFALKVTERLVVRSGYGIFYGYLEPYGDTEYLIGNPPYAYGVTLTSSPTTPAVWLAQGPPPGAFELTRATGLTFISYQRRGDIGNGQQWNFNIQWEPGRNWLFETGYSASKGTHLLRRYDDNFSPPGPGNINAKRRYQRAEIPGPGVVTAPLGPVYGHYNNGNSNYHAWISKLEKRFSGGYTLLASYSFSKAIGDTCGNAAAGDTAGCGFQDVRYLHLERSVANEDVPHRFVLSGIYELPFGGGRAGPHPSHLWRLVNRHDPGEGQRPAIQPHGLRQPGEHDHGFRHRQPAERSRRPVGDRANARARLQYGGLRFQQPVRDRQCGAQRSAPAWLFQLGLLGPQELPAPRADAPPVPLRSVSLHQHAALRAGGQRGRDRRLRADHLGGHAAQPPVRFEADLVASRRAGRMPVLS
jgi:hypothetical protein